MAYYTRLASTIGLLEALGNCSLFLVMIFDDSFFYRLPIPVQPVGWKPPKPLTGGITMEITLHLKCNSLKMGASV